MKKVLLRFYSVNNLGDDLFVKVIAERYKDNFTLIANKNFDLFATASNLKVYKNRVLNSAFFWLGRIFKQTHIWLRLLAKRHDILVYIGGSIFIEKDNLDLWRQEKVFYNQLKIPYYIIGANFGPHQTREFVDISTDIFNNAADVCFRDKASYDLFKNVRTTRLASDAVFALDRTRYDIKNEKVAVFSVVDCNNRFTQDIASKYDYEMAKLAERLLNEGYKVIFMSFCAIEGDTLAAERIVDRLQDHPRTRNIEIFDYTGNLEEAIALIAKSEIIVAARFHAAILGLLFSKKVLPFAYSKKTSNILKDAHFTGDIVDINHMASFDANNFDLNSLQINDISKQVTLAHLQFKKLDEILTKKERHES